MNYPVEPLTVEIIETYYRNDLSMFWHYMDNNIVWIGPGIQQYIIGKKNLIQTWANENHTLTFSTSHFSSKLIPGSTSTTCEVLAQFWVYTYYKDNYVVKHLQRITFFWKKVTINGKREWRYTVMHISNGMETDARDTIYPVHYDEHSKKYAQLSYDSIDHSLDDSLILRAEDYSTYYLPPGEVRYIKADGQFSEVHTNIEVIRVRHMLEELSQLLPDYFYRTHRSYIVNIHKIYHISRSAITLLDKIELPIPYKKYTQITTDIANLLHNIK